MNTHASILDEADPKSSGGDPRPQRIVAGSGLTKFILNFDVLVEASNGTKRLRSMILRLGLAGRLGTNDPRDRAAPLQLQNQNQNTAPLKGSPVAPHLNWRTCLLSDIAEIEMGNSPPGTSYNDAGDGVPLINGPVEFSPGPFGLTRRTKFTTAPARMCKKGDLLVCVRGATTGRTNIADFDACIGRGVALVRAHSNQKYLNYFMWSVGNDLLASGTGTTFPAISKDDLVALVVLLPPLAEQERIVAKVDQLMALCDELEARQTKKRETGTRLTKSALEALTTADTPEDFNRAWTRVSENFDVLVDDPDKAGVLRGVLRNLALRGVLTSRVPGDTPADTLVESIAAERERRIQAKECRRPEPMPPIDGSPFPIPSTWRWSRLGELCLKVADGPHFSPKYVPKEAGVPFLSGRNIRVDGFELDTVKHVSAKDHAEFCERVKPEHGDVLYTKGGTTGIALVNTLKFEFSVWVHVAVLKLDQRSVLPEYVALALNSPWCYEQSQRLTHGTGNRDLGLTRMVLISLPLPALKEQARIVERAQHFLDLSDQLAKSLRRTNDSASRLCTALASAAVA